VTVGFALTPLTSAADPNQPPVITSPVTATPNPAVVGQPVQFTVAAVDPDSDPLKISWNYGDGSGDSNATHSYSATGSYTAVATVDDGNGGTVTSSVTVTINPAPPRITVPLAAYPNITSPGQTVVFALSAVSPSGNPLNVTYNYGDGTSGTVERHVYANAGWYGASAIITDAKTGASVVSSAVVLVADQAPVINTQLHAWPSTASVGQSVLFTIAASDPDGDQIVVNWDYGDGTSGSVENHTYSSPGTYIVAAIVSDGKGGLAVSTTIVTVSGSGDGSNPSAPLPPPQVVAGPVTPSDHAPFITSQVHAYPSTAAPGQNVLFAVGVSDPDPVTVTWNYGDGTNGNVEHHTYSEAGSYAVVATVTDSKGNSNVSSTVVLVADAPPVIKKPLKAWPSKVAAGKKVLFTIDAVDPDNDPVTVTWYYGDGSSGDIEVHKYPTAGVYTPLALVSDGKGGMAVSTTTVTVTGVPATRAKNSRTSK
jgi:PKD repeat protein